MLEKLRYFISKISIYIFFYCSLFLIQRGILLLMFDAKKYILFDKVYLYEIVLAVICFIEVYKGIRISRPE